MGEQKKKVTKKLLCWGQISLKLANCTTFEEMEEVVQTTVGPSLPDYDAEHTVVSSKGIIDKTALAGTQKGSFPNSNMWGWELLPTYSIFIGIWNRVSFSGDERQNYI